MFTKTHAINANRHRTNTKPRKHSSRAIINTQITQIAIEFSFLFKFFVFSAEKEEIALYINRVNSRLATVELNVRTVRDKSQEDSLSQVNTLIDAMITAGDPMISRQRCQHYLNACSDNHSFNLYDEGHSSRIDTTIVDKKFESAILGCTLDDQKNIKKRLTALMNYLNKQTIHD